MGKSLRDACLVLAALAASGLSAGEPLALIGGRVVDVESGSVAEGGVIVDHDGGGIQALHRIQGAIEIACEYRRLETVRGGVGPADGFLPVLVFVDAHYRAEDLLL